MKIRVVDKNINTKKHFEEYYSQPDWRNGWDSADARLRQAMNLINELYEKHLDIGCADGTFTRYYLEKFPDTEGYGLDISEEVIKQALLKSPQIHFVPGDVYALPFKSDFFDMVHSAEVLEHLEEPKKAISEVYRVLKKGGAFILTVPNEQASDYEEHLWKWDLDGVRLMIKSVMSKNKLSGFEIVEEHPNFFNGHVMYLKCIKK